MGGDMEQFFTSRAGKQLGGVIAAAAVLSGLSFVFHEPFTRWLNTAANAHIGLVFHCAFIVSTCSFAYSILRLYDTRREIEDRRKSELKADYAATHDYLTRLPNRYAFERVTITRSVDDPHPPSAILFSIDLDGFKKVNDLLGHQGGDELLCAVAKRITSFVACDCTFRFGGDEFVAIAKNLPMAKAEAYAAFLIRSVSQPIRIGQIAVEVGASVGYAEWNEDIGTLDDACHRSDIALYEAKKRGPNSSAGFQPEMRDKAVERARVESQLRVAIDKGIIQPFYQPLVDLKTGDVCGFEALARWPTPEGMISPATFISLAEETGLITPLFQQLLRKACFDAMSWPGTIDLAFNVSPLQIEDRLLADRIAEILRETGFQPERLEVEITENALVRDPALAAELIDKLHALGIKIALDDFGTGYSNLSQLAQFKFDKVKIDRSFVSKLGQDDRQEKIVKAMLALSRSLNLKTTVEGLEQHAQLAYFIQEGCDVGQGYMFSQAVPASEVLSIVAALSPNTGEVSPAFQRAG